MTDTDGTTPDLAALFNIEADAVFDVLSNRRRRFVLAWLEEGVTPKPPRDVAYQLATWEYDA